MTEPPEEAAKSGFPYDVEQTRLDIKLTREELGETVQELVRKVNVPARAKEQVGQVAGKMRETMPPSVAEKAEQLIVAVRRNPWPAIGAAVLTFALLRRIARWCKGPTC
jgi:hypothetical protein